ncbi:MAG: alanine racemase [Desulfonauticus sp.]|nr:alanine racemase [Desulfonauticus sp.]
MFYNFIQVKIDLQKIVHNFLFLKQICPQLMPVVKANAYGHGLIAVAKVLAQHDVCSLAVGSVEEGVRLRQSGFSGEIMALLGPVQETDYNFLLEHKIIPFVHHEEQLLKLSELSKDEVVEIVLKFDTGMGRLGFRQDELPKIIDTFTSSKLHLKYVASHLAVADYPDDPFVLEQKQCFETICSYLKQVGLRFKKSLCNSAAVLGWPELHCDLARPGISLYGVNPFWGSKWSAKGKGLWAAMEVTAPIISVHRLRKGETISYGRTFKAPVDMKVAIVALGYADNYSRHISNKGWLIINGQRCPILGRVCMQMVAVDVSKVKVGLGDKAVLLGKSGQEVIGPEELALWWGTISYEVFCLLGQNKKVYVSN